MARGPRALAVLAALAIVLWTADVFEPRDFCTYYTAGLLANEEGAAAAFDLERLNQRHTALHPDSGRRVGSFYYSPVLLAPAALMARLDFDSAQMLNQLFILLALGGIFYLALEPRRPKWLVALLFLALVASDPVRLQFLYQNWTAAFVLLIALALRQTLAGRHRSAVLCWALALHLKLYAGLFLVPLWFLSCRPSERPVTIGEDAGDGSTDRLGDSRRLALGVLAVFVLLLALPLPWTGLGAPAAYLGSLAGEAGGGITVFYNQISIPASLARFARTPLDWVTSNRPVESAWLAALVWLSLAGFTFAVWRMRRQPGAGARALALTVPYLLLFVPKMWDHGQLLFLALFAAAVLPRRLEAFAAGYLVLSVTYFPLVQHLLEQTLRGQTSPLQLQALLLFYPLLNLLAAAALLQGERAPAHAAGS